MAILGNMMNLPLLISSILTHAANNNPNQRIVTALDDGSTHDYTYTEFAARTKKLAVALTNKHIQPGDRVGTLAWNGYRHLEIYYATSGIGAICHTINPRLHLDQIAFIINDAQDSILFFDHHFTALVDKLATLCPGVKEWVLLSEGEHNDRKDDSRSSYSDWLTTDDPDFAWPIFDENTASGLCYTSGTTGNPKGALYSHRSTVLHAYASCHPDAVGISCQDAVMPLVPMFHVNAWGLPYSSLLSGAKIVMPGANLKGDALYRLCESEGVSISAGVPSVWQGLLDHTEEKGLAFSTLRRAIIGGAACPAHMILAFARINVAVRHAWGMTEVSPLGTVCTLMSEHKPLSAEEQHTVLSSQGRPLFGVEFKIIDENGKDLPHDGVSTGDLMVKGNWVINNYYRHTESALADGWFHTGDVATIDKLGYLRITDRSKDVIKSGGEWISSIDIENIAMEHPDVRVAACIAQKHDKWGERPLLIVVKKPLSTVAAADILNVFTNRIPKWSIPDEVRFIDDMPMTATGKLQKNALRKLFEN